MEVGGLLGSIERAGGYAALMGLILLGLFWLSKRLIDEQARRASERERELQRRHERELERECANAAAHREDKMMLVEVVQESARASTALVGAVEGLNDTQQQTNERLVAIDRHLAGIGAKPRTGAARPPAAGTE